MGLYSGRETRSRAEYPRARSQYLTAKEIEMSEGFAFFRWHVLKYPYMQECRAKYCHSFWSARLHLSP